MVVVSQFPDLASELSNKHRLRLHPLKEVRVTNGYNQRVYSALYDNNCQVMYFIWGHSMEEASKVTDPPVSDLVRELVARPLPAADLKKVVFVQLGSNSAVPLSTMIHQFSLKPSPSDENFNVHECANSIYEKARDLLRSDELQSSGDVDAVKRATQRIARTVSNEVTPTELTPPQNITPPPSPPPPSYNTAMNTGGLESHSMPAIGQFRTVEQLCTTESASVGNSPQLEHIMKAQLAAQKELVGEVQKLRETIGDTAERHSDKVVAAIQGDKGTTTKQLDVINTNLEAVGDTVRSVQDTAATMGHKLEEVKGEVSIVKERTEKLQDTVEGVDARAEELGDAVEDLRKSCSVQYLMSVCLRDSLIFSLFSSIHDCLHYDWTMERHGNEAIYLGEGSVRIFTNSRIIIFPFILCTFLGERFDEATLEQELSRKNQKS